jgi:predicted DNA-binding protein
MNELKDHFVTIRMPIELFKIVKELADEQTRSVSRQIIHLIKAGLEEKK